MARHALLLDDLALDLSSDPSWPHRGPLPPIQSYPVVFTNPWQNQQYAHPSWQMHWRHPQQRPIAGPSSLKQRYNLHYHSPPAPHSLYPHNTPLMPTRLNIPELSPPSPVESAQSSPTSTLAPPTPEPIHIVCNAPLLAPKPLPYRPPAFISQFELPDPDEDLSYPPYTSSCGKRKRTRDEHDEHQDCTRAHGKRRATEGAIRGLPLPSSSSVSHRRSLCQ